MERKNMSRTYQENLLINLIEQFSDISMQPDAVATSKKILVSVRYFVTHFIMDEDIIEEMDGLVDKIVEKLSVGTIVPLNIQKTCFIKAND